MGQPKPDFLSLLLRQEAGRGDDRGSEKTDAESAPPSAAASPSAAAMPSSAALPSNATGASAAEGKAPASVGPPRPVVGVDPPAAASPERSRPDAAARAAAASRREAREDATRIEPKESERVRVELPAGAVVGVEEIVRQPPPPQSPQGKRPPLFPDPSRERAGVGGAQPPFPRALVYSILGVALVGVCWFAWQRLGGRIAAQEPGSRIAEPPAGNGGLEGVGPRDAGPRDPGWGDVAPLPPTLAGGSPALGEPGAAHWVIRAISYRDDAEGMARATSTAQELQARGFPDARAVRIAQSRDPKRFDVVVIVGLGSSNGDPALVALRERLEAVPPINPGEKKPPFAGAYLARQPEGDPLSSRASGR